MKYVTIPDRSYLAWYIRDYSAVYLSVYTPDNELRPFDDAVRWPIEQDRPMRSEQLVSDEEARMIMLAIMARRVLGEQT